jgi:hypothetical protein
LALDLNGVLGIVSMSRRVELRPDVRVVTVSVVAVGWAWMVIRHDVSDVARMMITRHQVVRTAIGAAAQDRAWRAGPELRFVGIQVLHLEDTGKRECEVRRAEPELSLSFLLDAGLAVTAMPPPMPGAIASPSHPHRRAQ